MCDENIHSQNMQERTERRTDWPPLRLAALLDMLFLN